MKHKVSWNTVCGAIQDLPWRNIWLADNPSSVPGGLKFSQCLVNCPSPQAYCMHGLLTCNEAYEFGQLGTGLSWFR